MCLKPGAVSGSASRRPRKCLVNTAQIAFLNKIHSRQLANPQEIRPAAEKFNEFLGQNSHPQKVLLSALAQWWSWGILVPGILALDQVLPFLVQRTLPRLLTRLCLGPLVAIVYGYVVAALKALLGVGAVPRHSRCDRGLQSVG